MRVFGGPLTRRVSACAAELASIGISGPANHWHTNGNPPSMLAGAAEHCTLPARHT